MKVGLLVVLVTLFRLCSYFSFDVCLLFRCLCDYVLFGKLKWVGCYSCLYIAGCDVLFVVLWLSWYFCCLFLFDCLDVVLVCFVVCGFCGYTSYWVCFRRLVVAACVFPFL